MISGVATGGARGAECHPWQQKKKAKNWEKEGGKREKIRKKEEKSERKCKNREGFFHFAPPDRAGYATGHDPCRCGGGGGAKGLRPALLMAKSCTSSLLWGYISHFAASFYQSRYSVLYLCQSWTCSWDLLLKYTLYSLSLISWVKHWSVHLHLRSCW